jgi:hypothetical protein
MARCDGVFVKHCGAVAHRDRRSVPWPRARSEDAQTDWRTLRVGPSRSPLSYREPSANIREVCVVSIREARGP